MGHNVGAAADRAVKNSERVKPAEMTREQWIGELRKNFKAGLFIPSHQTAALIAAHDEFAQKLELQADRVAKLETENIDMRRELKELRFELSIESPESEKDSELLVLGHLHPDVKTETDHKMFDPEAAA